MKNNHLSFLIVSLFILISSFASAQTGGLSIVYKHSSANRPPWVMYTRTVYTDSAVFSYLYKDDTDPFKSSTTLGNTIIHHGTFFDRVAGKQYGYVDFPQRYGSKFIFLDSARLGEWELRSDTKMILGCRCNKAVNKKPIRTIIWFCPTLGSNDRPLEYGYPGIPLQIDYPENNSQTIRAVEIKRADFMLKMADGRIISSAEFQKM